MACLAAGTDPLAQGLLGSTSAWATASALHGEGVDCPPPGGRRCWWQWPNPAGDFALLACSLVHVGLLFTYFGVLGVALLTCSPVLERKMDTKNAEVDYFPPPPPHLYYSLFCWLAFVSRAT